MKKVFILIIAFGLIAISCQKQIDTKKFNRELLKIIKENSLYKDSINWAAIEKEIDTIENSQKDDDKIILSLNCVIAKLREAGDIHSSFIPKMETMKMSNENLDEHQPEAKKLENNISYIKVPGFMSFNDTISFDFAFKIQSYIKAMDNDSIRGWIIDLRDNSGGNMYPMIAGLGPLLGNGILGYFIDNKGRKVPWSYQNGVAKEEGSKDMVKISDFYTIKNQNAKIAILINNNTASSGEMTAISFIGKPNTKIFGQVSAGYTTANEIFKLLDGSCLSLATSYVADRNMKKYTKSIIPDVIIYDFVNADNSLKEAINWLKNSN